MRHRAPVGKALVSIPTHPVSLTDMLAGCKFCLKLCLLLKAQTDHRFFFSGLELYVHLCFLRQVKLAVTHSGNFLCHPLQVQTGSPERFKIHLQKDAVLLIPIAVHPFETVTAFLQIVFYLHHHLFLIA